MNLDILRRCVDELEQFQKRKETVGRGEDSETKRTINYLKRIIIANEPDEKIKLATEIRDFLEKHGGRDANSANEPGKWNSPDAFTLEGFAIALEQNLSPLKSYRPDSSWLHGGYVEGGMWWHNELIAKIDLLLSKEK